jgi:hypothetical protein
MFIDEGYYANALGKLVHLDLRLHIGWYHLLDVPSVLTPRIQIIALIIFDRPYNATVT